MISLIVCSINPENLEAFKDNVEQTIGTEHEFVIIDNRVAGLSIFEAYNLGVSRSHGSVLCFVHEDIKFHTADWGPVLEAHFRDNADLGAVGSVGSHIMLKGKDWRDCPFFSYYLIQRRISRSSEKRQFNFFGKYRYRGRPLDDVVALDGMFISVRASLFDRIRFDDGTFKGFHQYDADICLQILDAGMRVCVCYDILLEHFSEGSYNPAYLDALKILQEKWESKLPLYRGVCKSDLQKRRYKKWVDGPQWSASALTAEEMARVHQDFILRDFGKAAPTLEMALEEIAINEAEGYISAKRARQLRIKTVFYRLTGLFREQRKLNS